MSEGKLTGSCLNEKLGDGSIEAKSRRYSPQLARRGGADLSSHLRQGYDVTGWRIG